MQNKVRKPWIAGLLTFFSIGLGHIYAGEAKRGLILYLGQSIVLLSLLSLFVAPFVIALAVILVCGFAYFTFCFLDSVKCARAGKTEYRLKKYNKWYVYFAYWAMVSIIIQPAIQSVVKVGIKENIVQAYKIPAGSMMPTLLVGDHILVNKYIYKNHAPKRGDIVVFEFPKDPAIDYIKRVIGLAGDLIEIKDKKLFINGVAQNEKFVIHTDKNTLPASSAPRDNFGAFTVPSNTLFVLGDNRDNSYDSRFWGIVDQQKIKGRAECFYWSWDKESSQIRWDRIGKSIE